MSGHKKTNGSLLKELLVNLATVTERINNYITKNNEDHAEIKDTLKTIQKITGDEIKDVDKRLEKLEKKNIELSTAWKIGIFLMGAIPTVITILNALNLI